jgi:carbon-monoxide dehydrogenase medium subunit
MKPPPFSYHAPAVLSEAVAILAGHGFDARVLAGGQSLIPLLNLRMARPAVLIDLNRCAGLADITPGADGVTFGAMVTQRSAEQSAVTAALCPLVAKALAHTGPVAVRNRATVGGTLAHADRVAELPGVAVALDATMVVASAAGQRQVPAAEFFLGDLTTAIEPEEMLVAVTFPKTAPNTRSVFLEVGIRKEGMAIVGLAAQICFAPGNAGGLMVREARLAITGVEPRPVRLHRVEAALAGQELTPALIAEACEMASASVVPEDDPMVKAIYRRRVSGSLVGQALRAMTGEAA